jgi:cobalt-zinc-cadmium efflux system membrane fusion protein
VHKGEVMAVLESRDLADAKAAFLNATEKLALARATFSREEDLWKKKISPEQDYLQAKQALAEARIELRSAEQKLHSLGFSDEYLAQLPSQPDMSYTRYEIAAPFEGTVIEKHISTGEAHKEDAEVFIVADLNSVWVNLSVYQKDMPFIRKGQPVVVSAGHGIPDTSGVISYIGPLVGEQTRTAVARVVLPNTGGNLRPGLFVTGLITVDSVPVSLLVPKTAIQTVEDKPSVFVKTDEGFVLQPVTVGRSNETHVEITSGIKPGTQYVKSGAFTLKAQLSKRAFGDGHAH